MCETTAKQLREPLYYTTCNDNTISRNERRSKVCTTVAYVSNVNVEYTLLLMSSYCYAGCEGERLREASDEQAC